MGHSASKAKSKKSTIGSGTTKPKNEKVITEVTIPNEGNLSKIKHWVNCTEKYPDGVCAAASALWLHRIKYKDLNAANSIIAKECDNFYDFVAEGRWIANCHLDQYLNQLDEEHCYSESDVFQVPIDLEKEHIDKLKSYEAMYISASKQNSAIAHAMAIYKDNEDTLYFFDPNKGIYTGNGQDIINFINKNGWIYKTFQLINLGCK